MTRLAEIPGDARPGAGPPLLLPPVTQRRPGNVVRVAMIAGIWSLPLLRPTGAGNTGPVDVVLTIAVVVAALWVSGQGRVMRFPYAVPVGLSVFAGALASTAAYAGGFGSVGGAFLTLLQDVFVWAWALAIANVGREPALLRSITRAWAISGTCWAALMIIGVFGHITALSGETAREGVRASLTLGDPNVAANYFICALLVLRAVRYPRQRLLRWACSAVILTAIVLTGSNGGALVLVVATLLGWIFGLARRRGAAAVLATSAVALCAVAVATQINTQQLVLKAQAGVPVLRDSIGRQAESSTSRTIILQETAVLYFAADNPLGIGANATKFAFQENQFGYVKEAHDDYAAALVERGVLGGAALLCLIVMVAVRCRRIATRPLRPRCRALIPRPELLGAAVVAVFASALFYQVLHFRHVWALFGLIAAVDLWGRADRAGSSGAPG
jgi:O-antigen ligase